MGEEIERLNHEEPQKLADYNLKDAELVIRILDKKGIIDLTIAGDGLTAEAARAQVDDMCRKLLSNPIIEDYTFEITKG